jgi:hypothetical protein
VAGIDVTWRKEIIFSIKKPIWLIIDYFCGLGISAENHLVELIVDDYCSDGFIRKLGLGLLKCLVVLHHALEVLYTMLYQGGPCGPYSVTRYVRA